MIEANAFRIFIRVYPLSKSDELRATFKLIRHKALINSEIIYACPALEFAAITHLLKIHCLQNKVLHTIGAWCTPVRDLYMCFQVLYSIQYMIT
jgi:hypothetical protein